DVQGRPISLGFNENPFSIQPCKRDPGYCFKDNNMEEKLERLQGVYCPNCGKKHEGSKSPISATVVARTSNCDCFRAETSSSALRFMLKNRRSTAYMVEMRRTRRCM